ncbi:MAG: hypothetical protein JO189_11340 [Deltaproteobacteria bacterium]|nr:hypothetical protein [Deltaproteobacteria bacterium]
MDRLYVDWAAMEARRRAVETLSTNPDPVLVDGKRRIAGYRIGQMSVVEGDARSVSVAPASIIAKVTRDSLITE